MAKTGNILVVDDEPGVRAVFEVLFGASHELRLLASAEEALATPPLTAAEVGVLFLDGQLGPGLSGQRALPQLKMRFPGARIVFIGALGALEAPALMEAGVSLVLPKPWQLHDLLASVD